MNTFLTKEFSTKLTDIIPLFLFSFTSVHTRKAYSNDLKSFTSFLSLYYPQIHILSEIDEVCISAWKKKLETEYNLHPSSVRRKLNCLSALFEFAKDRKYIEHNPISLVKKPQQNQSRHTNALSKEEMVQIFNIIEQKIDSIKRNSSADKYANRKQQTLELEYAILHLLCGTGLRVGEVCKLTLGDLEEQKNLTGDSKYILHIPKAKGSAEHKVFLNKTTANIILNYKHKYRDLLTNDKPFFVRVQNRSYVEAKPITARAIYTMLSKHAVDANITKKISPHSIRAGVATFLHSKGVPLTHIQKQLGHADIATTSVYISRFNEIDESAALKLKLDES